MISELTRDNDVRVPGERRAGLRRRHEKEGVDVPTTLLEQINALADA
jgi:(2R)-3-sulfolactate dehydrogenase (NADP+)